jgi:hypothetical protein
MDYLMLSVGKNVYATDGIFLSGVWNYPQECWKIPQEVGKFHKNVGKFSVLFHLFPERWH